MPRTNTKVEVTGTVAPVVTPEVEVEVETSEFTVSDPTVLRPVELPLVVTPTNGVWANEAQAKFAQTLNGYAYKNPEKWNQKKDALLKKLSEIGKNPSEYNRVTGNGDTASRLKYGNRLIQTSQDN